MPLLVPPYMPKGHIYGGQLANDADTDHDISCAAGEWISDDADPADRVLMRLTSAIVKRLDDTFVAGTGNGGLLSGSLANATWYYPWIIWHPTNGTDMVWSTSQTSLTPPTGYTKKCLWREGAGVLTNSSANILGFKNVYGLFIFDTPIADQSTTSPSTSDPLLTVSVPQGFSVKWLGTVSGTSTVAGQRFSSGHGISAIGTNGGVYTTMQVNGVNFTAAGECITNTSGQIRNDASSSSNWSSTFIITNGWECLR